MKKFFASLLTCVLLLGLLPTAARAALDGQAEADVPVAAAEPAEQFPGLTTGGTYWFDLSGEGIPGTVNTAVPDGSLHWVPFTYVGTINAYKLTSAQSTTEEYANQNKYDHSLFIADYNVTHSVSWNNLNDQSMIFGKTYTSGGVGYTLRTPSAGSYQTGSGDDQRGTPQSNEWDVILDKGDAAGYIKNWSNMLSWGQDNSSLATWYRALRGSNSVRYWSHRGAAERVATFGFRPVLELPAPDALASDSLNVVTLDLNGGKAGTTATAQDGPVNIVVKSGEDFTAPSSEGLTRPNGNTGSYSKWMGDDGNLYAPNATVPASVENLTAVWQTSPAFSQQPENKEVTVNVAATFTAFAVGEPSPTYQWQVSKNSGSSWEDISGATGSSYTTEAASGTMNGWQYRCVATNSGGSATSSAATLTVQKITPTPDIPSGLTAIYGQTLANVDLPTGWAWDDVLSTSVGNIGDHSFPATYTQDNSGNYNEVKQNLTVTVSAAPRTITVTGQADSPIQVTLNAATVTPSGGAVTYAKNTVNEAPADGWQSGLVFSGLTANTTYYFFAKVEANGNYAAAISEGVSITTPAKSVSSIAIANQPTTLSYISGQTLDLSGLSVTVTYNDSTTDTIVWSNNKLTADPAAGTVLTVTGHNGKTVTVSYGGATAETSALTVTQGTQATASITGAPATIYNGDSFTLTLSGGSSTGAVTWEIVSGPATVDATTGKVTVTGTGEIQIKAVKAADADYTQAEATIKLNAVARPSQPTGGGGGGTYTPTYPPTVEKPSEGGGIPAVTPSNPKQGDTVTVTPRPDTGYEVDQITIIDRNGKPVEVTKKPDGTYTFKQPSGKVTVEVTYQPIDRPWSNPFADVSESDWYYEAVRFVQERGLMNGIGNGNFAPNTQLSRAQLAQILFNKEGKPGVNYLMDFSDVAGEAWYTEAIRWATSQGIVGGYGNGIFGPNDPITREQLAVMLWRYSGSPAATNKELHFNDTDEISGFALEALRWAVENGILNGYGDGRLGPQGQATRAQVAQMLKNFIEDQENKNNT